MFSQLPVSLWHPASISDSKARGSGFKYHFLQIFILNSVEFYRISSGKSRMIPLNVAYNLKSTIQENY